ncbi:hypothetical protein KKH18_01910 [bacterium]|nr:hypothetical protein [bacterium]
MSKVIIHLAEHEHNALSDLAEREYRTLQAQAAIIIHHELVRCGALPNELSHEASFSAPILDRQHALNS